MLNLVFKNSFICFMFFLVNEGIDNIVFCGWVGKLIDSV